MKTILILFFLIVSIIHAQRGTCTAVQYALQGEKCDPSPESLLRCKDFLKCTRGRTENICLPGHLGAYCKEHEDCYGHVRQGVRCVDNVCVKPSFNGYSCTSNEGCFGHNCVNGICVGKKINEPCNPEQDVECDKGLFCHYTQRKCVPQLLKDQSCAGAIDPRTPSEDRISLGSNYWVVCQGGSRCQQGVCTPFRQKKEGERCNRRLYRSSECEYGLECSVRRGVCTKTVQYQTPCVGAARNCSTEKNEFCWCGVEGNPRCVERFNSQGCNFPELSQKWINCMIENNCPNDARLFTAMEIHAQTWETCMGKHCGHIAREALCCAFLGYSRVRYTGTNRGPIQCATNVGWLVTLVVFLTIISLVIVGVLVAGIFIYRKKFSSSSFQTLE